MNLFINVFHRWLRLFFHFCLGCQKDAIHIMAITWPECELIESTTNEQIQFSQLFTKYGHDYSLLFLSFVKCTTLWLFSKSKNEIHPSNRNHETFTSFFVGKSWSTDWKMIGCGWSNGYAQRSDMKSPDTQPKWTFSVCCFFRLSFISFGCVSFNYSIERRKSRKKTFLFGWPVVDIEYNIVKRWITNIFSM